MFNFTSMERLIELYNELISYPNTCNLNSNQKSKVYMFIREFNKYLPADGYKNTICGRYTILNHAKRYLEKHGKL